MRSVACRFARCLVRSRIPFDPMSLPTHEAPRDGTPRGPAFPATTQVEAARMKPDGSDDLETPGIGRDIDHFRVLRTIGRGGMGQVLLARDTRLGRLVALKLIREDRLDEERATALMAEARVTARLSHPNIVTIHHVGRWGHSPYLALEYVEGTTLRVRLNLDPPTPREAQRIALAISHALEAAHASRVTHCDLKPENVLLPPDGRLRVVDFGIARVVETLTSDAAPRGQPRVAGTPGYMAPEQWQGEATGAAADVWALGVILYEMLTGHRPFEGPAADGRPLYLRVLDESMVPRAVPGADNALMRLLAGMLTRDPSRRPTAAAVAQQLEWMLAQTDTDGRPGEAPFRGLLAFEERHAAFFFGRDAEVDAGVERLRTATVLPVVGQSGAGKSSFVQAGVLPRLREQGPWTVVSLRPGPRPLTSLAARLLALDTNDSHGAATAQRDTIEELTRTLLERPSHANVRLHALADQTRSRVLLFVDQLEEVITHGCSSAEAQAFLDAVASGADAVDDLVRVIFTLRDDFLGRAATGDAMAAVLANVLVVRRLDDRHLREAALRPLERLGFAWDDSAVLDRIVAELSGLPAALPLLQFACAELWERRDQTSRLLRRADYEALGGVAGALALHAESVFEGLSPADLDVARRLLLRLVGPDGVRRAMMRRAALEGLGSRATTMLERLTNARLLTVRRTREGAPDDAVLELAHESLLRTWPQLVRWLEESSEERAVVAEIEAAAALWHTRGRRREEVWPLTAVHDARARLRREADTLSPQAIDFLREGESLGIARQRRNRLLGLGAAGVALIVTVISLLAATELARRERTTRAQATQIALAAGDTGLVRLEIELVDWDAHERKAKRADAAAFPELRATFWETDPNHPQQPGQPRDPRFVIMSVPRVKNGLWTVQVETRSGPAFLRVAGRGVASQTCAPSQLQVRNMPGYGARQRGVQALHAVVPTCQASAADLVEIPEGPFYFGGQGDPHIAGRLPPPPERLLDAETYRIDRTEMPNAWFEVYARNQQLTGEGLPDYPPDEVVHNAAKADHPVTAIDAHGAEALCAWLGKRLPTTEEWTKAARGGLTLDRSQQRANVMPRRNLPWGQGDPMGRMNLADTRDPWQHSAPVDALPLGASPYGVLAMADNVAEWTASNWNRSAKLRVIRGAQWDVQLADGMHSAAVQNERNPRYFSFDLGFRCMQAANQGETASQP